MMMRVCKLGRGPLFKKAGGRLAYSCTMQLFVCTEF